MHIRNDNTVFKTCLINICFLLFLKNLNAQNFRIECDTADGFPFSQGPIISRYNNFIKDFDLSGIPLEEIKMEYLNSHFQYNLKVTSPEFVSISNHTLLAIPKSTLTGVFRGYKFYLNSRDSNDINFHINDIESKVKEINWSGTFSEKLKSYDTLKLFLNSKISQVSNAENFKNSRYLLTAFEDYCNSKLSEYISFSLSNFTNNNERSVVQKIINEDIKINNPKHWLELQQTRIFLRWYYLDFILAKSKRHYKYELQNEMLFQNSDIKKYLEFQYYYSLSNSDSAFNNVSATITSINNYEKKYYFSDLEKKSIQILKDKFQLNNKNVLTLFSKQKLANRKGLITDIQKKELIKGNVIVYYWATWCVPCIETFNELTKSEFMANGKQYKMLFISVDNNQEKWMRFKNRILNNTNSFLLKDFKSPSFYKTVEIQAVPRVFLIENGILKNQNYTKEEINTLQGI